MKDSNYSEELVEKMRQLYPALNEAELAAAAENFRAHAALSLRMWMRRKREADSPVDNDDLTNQ